MIFLVNLIWAIIIVQPFQVQADANDIAVDATSSTNLPQNQPVMDEIAWSHTVGAGDNRILIVGVSVRRTSSGDTITGITYGAAALTFIGAEESTDPGRKYRAELWRLVAPAIGTATITVTFSDDVDSAVGGAISLTGVHQTTPTGTFAGGGGSSGTPSATVASASRDMVLGVMAIKGKNNNAVTPGVGQIERWNNETGNDDNKDTIGVGSTAPGATSVTMTWSVVSEEQWAAGAVSLKPAVPPTLVTLRSFTATRYQDGVRLQWQTGLDVNNLGWHVYREVNGARVKLTPDVIAGSALMVGPGIQLSAGNAYQWWDPSGNDTDRYWLADRDLDGHLTMHGPVTPVVTSQPSPLKRRSPLLSQAGRKPTTGTKARVARTTRHRRHQSHAAVRQGLLSSQTLKPWELPGLQPDAIQYALAAAPAIKLDI